MECARCKKALGPEEAVTRGAETLCEDCLMDAMSPTRACDPWAVKLAKGASKTTAEAEASLQGLEKQLYELVKSKGRVPRRDVPALLGVGRTEVERAFAVLRHMELLRADRGEGSGVDYVLFGQ